MDEWFFGSEFAELSNGLAFKDLSFSEWSNNYSVY